MQRSFPRIKNFQSSGFSGFLRKYPFIFRSCQNRNGILAFRTSSDFFNTDRHLFLNISNNSSSFESRRAAGSFSMSYLEAKGKFSGMSLEEKRNHYQTITYVALEDIPILVPKKGVDISGSPFTKMPDLNEKVSIFVGDMTTLEVDAIVNAANDKLRPGGGVCGAIHKAAGPNLAEECAAIANCPTGSAVITGGYQLPAKYVIHAVGPMGENPELLKSCYEASMRVAMDNGCKSIAFPCIATGIYGYPNENAANVALKAVRTFMEANKEKFSRVVFCVFLDVDKQIYENLTPVFFPS